MNPLDLISRAAIAMPILPQSVSVQEAWPYAHIATRCDELGEQDKEDLAANAVRTDQERMQ